MEGSDREAGEDTRQVEITSQNLADNASIIQSMEQSKHFSDDDALDKSQKANSNSYLDEVDKFLVGEVKAKTKAE